MDLSSEIYHALLPAFITMVLGLPATALGAIDGTAEATANMAKLFSGRFSDRSLRRKPWVMGGYGLAALSKPLFALASNAPSVFVARFADKHRDFYSEQMFGTRDKQLQRAKRLFDPQGAPKFPGARPIALDDVLATGRSITTDYTRIEGVFRQHMIIKGRNRDTAWYAMLDHEWPAIRDNFEVWLDQDPPPSLRELNAALRP